MMECPICGVKLPTLAAVLAQTERGTQCPNCWTRLRQLATHPVVLAKKATERRTPSRRRAA